MMALWMAVASMVIQLCVYFYTSLMGHKYASQTLVAKSWHNLVDAVSTLGALVAVALAIALGDKWVILDPLAACIISIAVLVLSVKVLVMALKDLLDVALPIELEDELVAALKAVQTDEAKVLDVTAFKTRHSGPDAIVEAVLLADAKLSVAQADALREKAIVVLRSKLGSNSKIHLSVQSAL